MDQLESISPIDGRYRRITEPLAKMFSEGSLIRYRLQVECEYLIALSEHPEVGTRGFSPEETKLIRSLYAINTSEARIVKDIEVKGYGEAGDPHHIKPTNHDVKAVEYYMKLKLKGTSLEDSLEWIHFGLTSEDINNIAYGLMLSDGIGNILVPALRDVYQALDRFSDDYKDISMLARSHGQAASPTTMGKEFKVFSKRLQRQVKRLRKSKILAKLNGATGNYNAHHVAYPKVDWIRFSKDFFKRFNNGRTIELKSNLVTTQIEPHDSYAELFDSLRRIHTILIGFDQDMWRYISDDWLVQKPAEGEVGSSTMPHKVNPIDFENSEGNLGFANALFGFFSAKLPISRLQRDLSDSTVERNFGVALGHALIGYTAALKGLGKVSVNEAKIIADLVGHPEVISEAYQTILRREGQSMPYEKLKELTRGKKVTLDELRGFVETLPIPPKVLEELRAITPQNYIGIANILAKNV